MALRNWALETEQRVEYIKSKLAESRSEGIVYGNSGGKDCALVGILCKMACENTVGIIMPCASSQNYGSDKDDAESVAQKFGIEMRLVDLTPVREAQLKALEGSCTINDRALTNIAPRLRMITVYAIGAAENRLVAGTGNASEKYMGYFTKWGDGAHDFNPISDLTVTEIYDYLRYLGAPESIINKAPSAGLFEGQTDEKEMGVSYAAIDKYITTGEASPEDKAIIERFHAISEHKRQPISTFEDYKAEKKL